MNPSPTVDLDNTPSSMAPSSANHGSDYAYLIPASVQFTADMYWAYKPPAVRVLRQSSGPSQQPGTSTTFKAISPLALAGQASPLYSAAQQLAMNGYQIDPWIDAQGFDPVITMMMRQEDAIPATAPLLSTSVFTPTPQAPVETGVIPAGWIKTSLNPADYPPFPAPPAPPAVPGQAQTVVGNFEGQLAPGVLPIMPNGGILFGAGPLALQAYHNGAIISGQPFTENNVKYQVSIAQNIFGGVTISFYIPS